MSLEDIIRSHEEEKAKEKDLSPESNQSFFNKMKNGLKYGTIVLSSTALLSGCAGIKVNGADVTKKPNGEKSWCQEHPYKCAGVIIGGALAIGGAVYLVDKLNDDDHHHKSNYTPTSTNTSTPTNTNDSGGSGGI